MIARLSLAAISLTIATSAYAGYINDEGASGAKTIASKS
jgi:hypothetical protein